MEKLLSAWQKLQFDINRVELANLHNVSLRVEDLMNTAKEFEDVLIKHAKGNLK
ncbi:MAG: hypothetical protein ACXW1D_00285 [Halobacteriota archaeon]